MKTLTARTASILLAVLFLSLAAHAQEIPKCVVPAALPPASGCILVDYDRFKDSTTASLQFTVVDRGADQHTVFMILTSFPGSQPGGKTEQFAVGFVSAGTKLEPSRSGREVYVLVDGNSRFTMALMTLKANTNFQTGVASEQTMRLMTPEEITRLVRAKTLEMKLGNDEFAFSETMRGNLQRFCAAYCSLPTAH